MENGKEESKPKNGQEKPVYFVCNGALCACDAGAKPAKLTVTVNQKVIINDDEDSYLATDSDMVFNPPAAPFLTCKNNPSSNKCCAPVFEKWENTYEKIDVQGNSVLTENSTLKCKAYNGTVKILHHGQFHIFSPEVFEHMKVNTPGQAFILSPIYKPSKEPRFNVVVRGIKAEVITEDNFKPVSETNKRITTVSNGSKNSNKEIPVLRIRPGEKVKFKADFKGTKSLVSWKVNLFTNTEPFYFLQHGETYETRFTDEGIFEVEAYGTGGDGYPDTDINSAGGLRREDRSCTIKIEVTKNKLTGIGFEDSENSQQVGDVIETRAGVPITFRPEFIFPPTVEEIFNLDIVITDGSSSELLRVKGQPYITFLPENPSANYFVFVSNTTKSVKARFSTIQNEVTVIGCNGFLQEFNKVRPGTKLSFKVCNLRFNGPASEEIKQKELDQIQWHLKTPVAHYNDIANGSSFSDVFHQEGNYIVKCSVRKPSALWFLPDKNVEDDWRFTVTKNYITSIEVLDGKKAKVGGFVIFKISTIFPDITYFEKDSIVWNISGPEHKEAAECIQFPYTFRKKGKYKVTATMNGRKPATLEIECIECEISGGWWTDKDGNFLSGDKRFFSPSNTIGFSSWGQDICATFAHKGMEGEKILLKVYDKDYLNEDDLIPPVEHIVTNSQLQSIRITLTDKIKKKIENFFKTDALLYFKVEPVTKCLFVKNIDNKWPSSSNEYLTVNDTIAVRAYFADNNDTKRFHTADKNQPVYIQVKSNALQYKDLKVELWESINCGEMFAKVWESQFFKVDKFGMHSIPLKLKEIEFKNNNEIKDLFIKIYKQGQEEPLFSSLYLYQLKLYRLLPAGPEVKSVSRVMVCVGDCEKRVEEVCECKSYNLVWGDRVNCEFRKKVVQICKELWGEKRKIDMANGLMSVMNVETFGTFAARKIEGVKLKEASLIVKEDFVKVVNGVSSSRAVGLIQFTQDALLELKEFVAGSGFDSLHQVKLRFAQMTEIQQLDFVKRYLENAKDKIKDPEDIYLKVFAPTGLGKKENDTLYAIGSAGYASNKSVDFENKGNYGGDGKIQRFEILNRYRNSFTSGIGKTDIVPCKGKDSPAYVKERDIITFKVYSNGNIEKHIPRDVHSDYKEKFKYNYIDKTGVEHQVCVLPFIEVDKRKNGKIIGSVPSGYINVKEYPNGGDAKKGYIYTNGDIVVTGNSGYGNIKYCKDSGKVSLVRMKDCLSYNNLGVIIYYGFKNSHRRYCMPETFAGFIGVLAELGRTDILSTGMCFMDSTSYPSLEHPNGDSIDTAYFDNLKDEQKKVDAFKKFHFVKIIGGDHGWYSSLKSIIPNRHHNDHLHSGNFDYKQVKIIRH